ncbi:MAG: bifunctional pyr operon transcriptional regulator/uracil phosphoribosyltransferase PyrR [Methylophilales bacterium]|jgi:pyrimidine operon attenuation protein / uracil phosphoribosyltransferase|nr:bifunctional pyr operon transcriptional regulator/uracil phosphoribosyltransferase PyrR [Pseudomonadota bacterium]NQW34519.1 bifunctional pyr operon transcriptional regulator/uracil phosphoribosyltransferase PyrR [Methylophilales bacterium]HCK04333.1 bifunctional pyr operon transcriptional regulator/uracil phosphoribosyltransferase PyrR [Methylophilaceae bacterium]|tara:strand:+ start:74 stop:574 length:501 start_codon:yes stop_codon:yes gene_type:complete
MTLPEPTLLIERMYDQLSKEIDQDTCLIGILNGGSLILNELKKKIKTKVDYGLVDCSFYRDDLESSGIKIREKSTSINFNIDGKKIILIDDVFFTGRTIRAAMNELFDFGRPKEIKLFVLIDREKNELPIKPTFSTYKMNKSSNEYIDLILENDKLIFRSRKSNDQ